MKRRQIFRPASFLVMIIMLAVAIYIPNTLPVGSDFSALYYADLALVNGVRVYDIPNMEALALSKTDIPPENFFMPRFPYPPWYMLSTFYLGLLPIQSAGALWFQLNLIMLFLSVWFLTDGWNGRLRLIAFPLALFFLPVLGALSVGQYDFPVLLGTSLLVYSLRKENVALTTLGAVLLTFKPHIGVLILLSALGWLLGSRSNFGRRALRSIVMAGVGLSIVSLIADPLWFVNYPKMLLNYQGEGNVTACSECASVPVWTSRWLFDGSLAKATLIAVLLLIALTIVLWSIRKSLLKSPESLITSALLVTLLVSPYLYNYDFILLLVPLAVILNSSTVIEKIVVLSSYLIPSFAIILFGREGNIALNAATIVVAFILFLRAGSQVDVPAFGSYNTNK
jgi:hypothetical protein